MRHPHIFVGSLIIPVADTGFLEGGFQYNNARGARAKISKPRPLLIKTTPVFDRFGETSCSTMTIVPFSIEIFAKHAKVSHRISFLSSLDRERGST